MLHESFRIIVKHQVLAFEKVLNLLLAFARDLAAGWVAQVKGCHDVESRERVIIAPNSQIFATAEAFEPPAVPE